VLISDNGFDDGRAFVEAGKTVSFGWARKNVGMATVRVWYGGNNVVTPKLLTTIEKIKDKHNEIKGSSSGNKTKEKQQLYEYLQQLQTAGEIKELTIDANAPDLFTFVFANGTLGGWTVKEFLRVFTVR
jgi:CRISPR/Cas system-associated exonuclease Cas4 (RecB family)